MGVYHTGFVKETGALMFEKRTVGGEIENGIVSNLNRERGEWDEHKMLSWLFAGPAGWG